MRLGRGGAARKLSAIRHRRAPRACEASSGARAARPNLEQAEQVIVLPVSIAAYVDWSRRLHLNGAGNTDEAYSGAARAARTPLQANAHPAPVCRTARPRRPQQNRTDHHRLAHEDGAGLVYYKLDLQQSPAHGLASWMWAWWCWRGCGRKCSVSGRDVTLSVSNRTMVPIFAVVTDSSFSIMSSTTCMLGCWPRRRAAVTSWKCGRDWRRRRRRRRRPRRGRRLEGHLRRHMGAGAVSVDQWEVRKRLHLRDLLAGSASQVGARRRTVRTVVGTRC